MREISIEQQTYINEKWHEEFIDCSFFNGDESVDNSILGDYQIWLYDGWGYDNSEPHCQLMSPNRNFVIKISLITNNVIDVLVNDNNLNVNDVLILYNKWLVDKNISIKNRTNAHMLYTFYDGEYYFFKSKIEKYVKDNNITPNINLISYLKFVNEKWEKRL